MVWLDEWMDGWMDLWTEDLIQARVKFVNGLNFGSLGVILNIVNQTLQNSTSDVNLMSFFLIF